MRGYLVSLDRFGSWCTTWIRMTPTPWIYVHPQVCGIIRSQWWNLNKVSPAVGVSVSPGLSVLDLTGGVKAVRRGGGE